MSARSWSPASATEQCWSPWLRIRVQTKSSEVCSEPQSSAGPRPGRCGTQAECRTQAESRSFCRTRCYITMIIVNNYFWQRCSLKCFNNLEFSKGDPSDHTAKVDTYLKSPTFPASNGKCYNSLSSFRIFECHVHVIPRIFGIWEPGDRIVKVDTYLKTPTFSALNGKYYNSLKLRYSTVYPGFWS